MDVNGDLTNRRAAAVGALSYDMVVETHPYYVGLERWVAGQTKYTLASLAKAAGLDNTTILHAIRKGNSPSGTTIDKIRRVIELDYDAVVDLGRSDGASLSRPAGRPRQGFSESDVSPWIGTAQPDTGEQRVLDMAAVLSDGRGGRDIWRVGSRAMILAGYAEGDFILVDQHGTPEAGAVVIAQVYDHEVGAASTLLRRYDPPVLNAASTDPSDWKSHVVDGRNVKIMGVVTASWRTG